MIMYTDNARLKSTTNQNNVLIFAKCAENPNIWKASS